MPNKTNNLALNNNSINIKNIYKHKQFNNNFNKINNYKNKLNNNNSNNNINYNNNFYNKKTLVISKFQMQIKQMYLIQILHNTNNKCICNNNNNNNK